MHEVPSFQAESKDQAYEDFLKREKQGKYWDTQVPGGRKGMTMGELVEHLIAIKGFDIKENTVTELYQEYKEAAEKNTESTDQDYQDFLEREKQSKYWDTQVPGGRKGMTMGELVEHLIDIKAFDIKEDTVTKLYQEYKEAETK